MPNQSKITEEQRAEVVARRDKGETLQSVADAFGITRERVRQISMQRSTLSKEEIRENKAKNTRDLQIAHLQALKDAGKITKTTDVAQRDRALLPEVFTYEEIQEMRLASYAHRNRNGMPEEEILADMRRVADKVAPDQFSGPLFDKHQKSVGSVRVLQVFGTWINACKAAGITNYHEAIRDNYELTWPRETCLSAINEFLAEHPYGSYKSYEQWAREQETPKPSGGTLRNRVSRLWSECREEAIKSMS